MWSLHYLRQQVLLQYKDTSHTVGASYFCRCQCCTSCSHHCAFYFCECWSCTTCSHLHCASYFCECQRCTLCSHQYCCGASCSDYRYLELSDAEMFGLWWMGSRPCPAVRILQSLHEVIYLLS
jgi:hypothetical protein